MTNHQDLDAFDTFVKQATTMELLAMITREVIAISRDLVKTRDHLVTENSQLREFLHRALCGWIVQTSNVEEAVLAWQLAKDAGLMV